MKTSTINKTIGAMMVLWVVWVLALLAGTIAGVAALIKYLVS